MLVIKACYTGFSRGIVTELLSLLGLIAAIVLAGTYYGRVARMIPLPQQIDVALVEYVAFLMLFAVLALLFIRIVAQSLTKAIKWEASHWTLQLLGSILGGARGFWWAGFCLLLLLGSGADYFGHSIMERSIFGATVVQMSQRAFAKTASVVPGYDPSRSVIPQLNPQRHTPPS